MAGLAEPDAGDAGWSEPVHGLQARVTLIERPRINGTRWLVPYLELRNVSDSATPLRVRCGGGHVRFELVGADEEVIRDGWTLSRSGPHPDPGTIVLPFDSSIRVGMSCRNWGVPKDAAAMVATDSGAWVPRPEENGRVFLRATIEGEPVESDGRLWHGTIVAPQVPVRWDD